MMRHKQFFAIFFSFVLLLCASSVEAKSRQKKRPRKRAVVIKPDPPRPPELVPDESNRIPNQVAEKLAIPIIWDDEILRLLQLPQSSRPQGSMIAEVKYQLVAPKSQSYITIGTRNPTYPWINDFFKKFGEESYFSLDKRLVVNSTSRTVQRQRNMTDSCYRKVKIRRGRYRGQLRCVPHPSYNPHAAEVGDMALLSLHCRAIAIDISRKNLSIADIEWIRRRLIELKLQDIGIFPIEERTAAGRINCWHIVIFDPIEYQKLKDDGLTKKLAAP